MLIYTVIQIDKCHLENFVPIVVRGQNGSVGVIEYVDATSVQNVLIMWNFHKL